MYVLSNDQQQQLVLPQLLEQLQLVLQLKLVQLELIELVQVQLELLVLVHGVQQGLLALTLALVVAKLELLGKLEQVVAYLKIMV